jgi:hypothetical protein
MRQAKSGKKYRRRGTVGRNPPFYRHKRPELPEFFRREKQVPFQGPTGR